ncbi:MAG: PAS domain-containing protein, partial [Promethearchaeati archaeon]
MADWPTTLSNEEWRKILDSAVDDAAIVITDTNGTIIWANQDYSELTGYSLNEVFGHQIAILKRGQRDSSFYREIWTDIGSGKIWAGQVVNQRKDGSRYLEAVEIRPVISDDGSITHIL